MDTDMQWVVVEVDGRIASVSPDFALFAEIADRMADLGVGKFSRAGCYKTTTAELLRLSGTLKWKDLQPFGTEFQKSVWKQLFLLTHPAAQDAPSGGHAYSRLWSYSEFAKICGNEFGVRAVAHAVALNPIAVIVPCHLIVPKEAVDRLREVEARARQTLFGDYLIEGSNIDFGEYRFGRELKKQLIGRL